MLYLLQRILIKSISVWPVCLFLSLLFSMSKDHQLFFIVLLYCNYVFP